MNAQAHGAFFKDRRAVVPIGWAVRTCHLDWGAVRVKLFLERTAGVPRGAVLVFRHEGHGYGWRGLTGGLHVFDAKPLLPSANGHDNLGILRWDAPKTIKIKNKI